MRFKQKLVINLLFFTNLANVETMFATHWLSAVAAGHFTHSFLLIRTVRTILPFFRF